LRLVVIRFAPSLSSGATDFARCRSTAIVFDAKSTVGQLRDAVFDAVRQSFRVERTNLARAHLYTRVSASIVPVDLSLAVDGRSATVARETVVGGGCLRGSTHLGSALDAYERHCELRTTLCIRRATCIFHEWQRVSSQLRLSSEERRFAAMYAVAGRHPRLFANARHQGTSGAARSPATLTRATRRRQYIRGLRRLGAANPTDRVPEASRCSERDGCDCFMRRAMWRAGDTWLILYVVMPPPSAQQQHREWTGLTSRRPVAQRMADEWIVRLVDESSTASADDECAESSVGERATRGGVVVSPLDAVHPSAWHRSTNEYVEMTGVTSTNFKQRVEALMRVSSEEQRRLEYVFGDDLDDDLDDRSDGETSSTVSSSTCSLSSTGMTLIEAAVVYALERGDAFVDELGSIARAMGLYYRAMLQHVLAKAQRRRLVDRTVRRARQLARSLGDARLLSVVRPNDHGDSALVGGISLVVDTAQQHQAVGGAQSPSMRSSRATGYALVVVAALLMTCERLNVATDQRPPTVWASFVHAASAMLPDLASGSSTTTGDDDDLADNANVRAAMAAVNW